jgi:hypothetical protein
MSEDMIDDKFEVEIEDDTPLEDKGKPRRAEDAAPDIPADDELENYSESVQKRIKKLKYEFHEERRRKEEAERVREEAIRYAEAAKREAEDLRRRLSEGQSAVVTQTKARLDLALAKAKADYKSAYESGDSDALVAAQEQLTELQTEKLRLASYKPEPEQKPQQPQFQPQQPPRVQTPDARALSWMDKNPWFGPQGDPEMTALALGVHERLVKSGVDPKSETYYSEIDAAVRRRFPDKFGETEIEVKAPSRQAGLVVAPTSRTVETSRSTVRITSSAAALAKRLGLTPEQYAAQVLKERKNG